MDIHWCPREEQLLVRWAEKAAGYRWLHNHARMYYKWLNDVLSYPCIIISSITGVGGFAVLNPSEENMSPNMKRNILIFQYTFAFLNVVVGILTSISKFNNSAGMMEAHSAMCVHYSKLYRNIDMELSLDVGHRENAIEFVTKQRQEYDRLLDEAPDIPSLSIYAFNKAFPDKTNKPDVCNGLNVIQPSSDTETKMSDVISKWLLRRRRSKSNTDLDRAESA